MDDGVARVEFPSPVSHFEPLIPNGLSFAQTLRHEGRLWVLADGRALRGVYDVYGPLERFADDTPRGVISTPCLTWTAILFGANEEGICVYGATGWRLAVPGIVNARIGEQNPPTAGCTTSPAANTASFDRSARITPRAASRSPTSPTTTAAVVDSAGIGWIELGVSRIGRIRSERRGPEVPDIRARGRPGRRLDRALHPRWRGPFPLGGLTSSASTTPARSSCADRELLARYPQMAVAGGRPGIDGLGRLWFSNRTTPVMIDRSASGGRPFDRDLPVGFTPTSCTAEDERRRLDVREAPPGADGPPVPGAAGRRAARHDYLRAVLLGKTARSSRPAAPWGPCPTPTTRWSSTSPPPANPFLAPVTFEVMLEGLGSRWVSTGAVGSAAFNQLKEGDYVFRVRPVARGGGPGGRGPARVHGAPALVPLAARLGGLRLAVLGVFAFVVWLSSFLQHRENVRLERLVAERTKELNATNEHLGRQIPRPPRSRPPCPPARNASACSTANSRSGSRTARPSWRRRWRSSRRPGRWRPWASLPEGSPTISTTS